MTADQAKALSETARIHALAVFVAAPTGTGLAVITYLLCGGSRGEFVRQQVLNCYTTPTALYVAVGAMAALFVGLLYFFGNPIDVIARNRFAFLCYALILAAFGLFALRPAVLLAASMQLSLARRLPIALSNVLMIAAVGCAYCLAIRLWKRIVGGRQFKTLFFLMLLLWSYIFASLVRMLPLPYITGVE